ncbi:hypothetical protein [Paenibacillus flagellatus]|uniref:KTSC domain-containing protein n=1 Tax=Paenibacillus flagellatus TaxID=2211139 RepID=A0A2V5KY40_9BACL|nr:hypothetical protein [Paenibacillus flagellatus]PYI57527.1 hypothetical protein DLM86_03605 [Paenibacillus flagellatus]
MDVIPIESKQVGYVEYDRERSCMIAHFTTGEVRIYPVSWEEYSVLGASSNKYDCFVKMTSGRSVQQTADLTFRTEADLS